MLIMAEAARATGRLGVGGESTGRDSLDVAEVLAMFPSCRPSVEELVDKLHREAKVI